MSKYIIEIDDKDKEICKQYIDGKLGDELGDYVNVTELAEAIANGTPYNPTGDLISRSSLKATIIAPLNVNDAGKNDWYDGYYTAKNEDVAAIDSAQTVELRIGRMTNGVIIPIQRPQHEADMKGGEE